MNKTDDIGLWNAFLQGDKEALECLYIKYYDSLLNYGLKYNIHKTLVEDCIQDLFVKLYLGKNLSSTDYVQPYLLRSLRNTILKKISDSRREIDIFDCFDLSIDDSSLQRIFEKNDKDINLTKRLLKAYSALNANQKQIIYFRYIQDLSYRDIAEILEINEQSAMNLLSRSLAKLRKIIKLYIILIFF